jgi:hypothetical protein
MIVFMILFGIQLIVLVSAVIRESGEDERFDGDKLRYRS